MISYRSDSRPDVQIIVDLYKAAPLNRPIDDPDRIRKMYENSNLVLTAWDGERLAGILRGWHDGAFDGYICDLAVHPDYQKQGVGAKLLELCAKGYPKSSGCSPHRDLPPNITGTSAGKRSRMAGNGPGRNDQIGFGLLLGNSIEKNEPAEVSRGFHLETAPKAHKSSCRRILSTDT